ncbi:MAG: AmmeMemoRadiSam system protein B [Phycisphaerae bacterium]
MSNSSTLPALRPVEVRPIRAEDGDLLFVVRDYWQVAPRTLAVSPAGYFVMLHLNGRHTREQVAEAFSRQFESSLPTEQIDALIEALDESYLLENERFQQAYAALRAEYAASPVRDNRERYPGEAELRREIVEMLARQSPASARRPAAPAGMIAPHLDYHRGGPCYAAAYAVLAAAVPADRYVILGTNHYGRGRGVVATKRDFLTPLGTARTDVDFIDFLETRVDTSLCDDEYDHRFEHSIELQVHILQTLYPGRGFSIVPVLCPDPSGPTGTRPADGRGCDLGAFADALRDLTRDQPGTMLIASADLSHVGRHFGDPDVTTHEFLAQVGANDQRLLSLLAERREEEFVADVRAAGNATRICSVGCIYALLRALPNRACTILKYHQAIDLPAETNVTCAAGFVA